MIAAVQSLCKTLLWRQKKKKKKKMHERLFETFSTSKSESFHLTRKDHRPEI